MGMALVLLPLLLSACCLKGKCKAQASESKVTNPQDMYIITDRPVREVPELEPEAVENQQQSYMLPPIIIYKTKKDYRQLVPIIVSESGQVVGFPARSDLGSSGHFSYPVALADGYLWDRRGVSLNSVFLDLTYEAYAALPADPSPDTLLKHVLDRNPFTFMAVCDRSAISDVSKEGLDAYIQAGMPGAKVLIRDGKKIANNR